MKRQSKNRNSVYLIALQIIVFFSLILLPFQISFAQTQNNQPTEEKPVTISKDIAELGTDGWLTVKNYLRGGNPETFSVDVSDALLSITKDSVSSSLVETESILGIREIIVVFLKNGGVIAVRRNGRGTNCAGFKTNGSISAGSLEKSSSNADIWNIVVNGKTDFSVRVSGRPMDQVLIKGPRT